MIDQDSARQDSSASAGENSAVRPISAPRRKILVAGGTIAPIVLTLVSRPVLGNGGQCISPSATLSTSLSHKEQKIGTCSGKSPGYWMNHPGDWPISTSTTFYSIFVAKGPTHFYRTVGVSEVPMTMLEVLQANGTVDPQQMGAYFTAAYLAILKGWISPRALDQAKLIAMWTDWASTGYYHPYAGSTGWDAGQIKSYLTSNYIVL
ncbi:hypothetical protein [Niveibacterium terrae]|uniref:hypothetical protein n=1 Tax=Niveibacterium terrae TaxID=3373598 RepID=UPI003A90525F